METTRWVEEAVAWHGLHGRELVSVTDGDGRTFYFKRPVDEQTAEVAAVSVGRTATGVSAAEIADDPDGTTINPVRLIEEEFLPD